MRASILTPVVPRTRCSICTDESKSGVVNAMLATGKSPGSIEAQMRSLGFPVKEETIRKHRNGCKLPKPQEAHTALSGLARERADFAQLVHDSAVTLLENGEMRLRASDGLRATELLDRRVEQRANRDLLLNLARLMSGVMAPIPASVVIVEGEAREVSDDGLAPAALVAS